MVVDMTNLNLVFFDIAPIFTEHKFDFKFILDTGANLYLIAKIKTKIYIRRRGKIA